MGPLVFEPYYRPQVWGGRRLETALSRKLPGPGKYGEAWEVSGHPHHISRLAPIGDVLAAGNSPLCPSLTLNELFTQHRQELFGPGRNPGDRFPLLFKILDCDERLSVQVHPNDEQAAKILGDEKGKTEAWIVMDAGPDGRIYAGLKEGVDRAEFETRLRENRVESCLHSFTPRTGDCIFLKAGTVHAVGGGVLMAEIQQSSDATFRLFDWNRLGDDGKPRRLHIEESLACIDFSAGPVQPQTGEKLSGLATGNQGERLVDSEYFVVERYVIQGRLANPHPERLAIWMVLEGEAELFNENGVQTFRRGETVVFPASAAESAWQPASSARPTTLMSSVWRG